MGALRDFVARDPKTERPAVVNFPVLPDDHFRIDIDACRQLNLDSLPESLRQSILEESSKL